DYYCLIWHNNVSVF
nr:immunoglobulin light chain junction region [Macaca mulatta]MOX70661.1 immunoglobulin light chain junction region [Macaca mulatta]MOX71445.1 immunoglobulin light chain junction region [Macaca mulatta]MOX74934.1 immunoglobulin light chain junction region [Macaca mulatta]MOX75728.1 immunoglobulin light chain junction region [Macaca mulatta]